MRDKIWAAIAI